MSNSKGSICEECKKKLTAEEIKHNDRVSKSVRRLDYCETCWDNYCHHVITGE